MQKIKLQLWFGSFDRFLLEYFPLINILFFFEIVYFMFIISFLWGKIFGVALGFLATVFLMWQTLGLYNKKQLNRQIELLMIDLHFVLSIGFLVNRIFVYPVFSFLDFVIFIERGVAVLVEIPAVLFLTGMNFRKGN